MCLEVFPVLKTATRPLACRNTAENPPCVGYLVLYQPVITNEEDLFAVCMRTLHTICAMLRQSMRFQSFGSRIRVQTVPYGTKEPFVSLGGPTPFPLAVSVAPCVDDGPVIGNLYSRSVKEH